MALKRNWQYDEMKHSGVDYSDPALVEEYDTKHQKFRDYKKGTETIIQILRISTESTIIDMGAGTGAFALNAAGYCKTIYAVDVSKAMLDYIRRKAEQAGIRNIIPCHGGFLTYNHLAEPADIMVCTGVLHHLPDFWKLIGLKRVAGMLKPKGKLFLFDVVFTGNMDNYDDRFDEWVLSIAKNVGEDFASELEAHIRDEYSTFDWIMEGILERSGFHIENTQYTDGFGANYICTKS